MQIPESLSRAFLGEFEALIGEFAREKGFVENASDIRSSRFISRSIVPHVKKLSALFNRVTEAQLRRPDAPPGEATSPHDGSPSGSALPAYWGKSSNAANLRLAYFLYFMPANACRVAAVFAELARLGFRWPTSFGDTPLRGIEFGAGPATGACGVAMARKFGGIDLPGAGDWALIEQDKPMLSLGEDWAKRLMAWADVPEWGIRPYPRRIDLERGFLPRNAPRFHLWLMSYFLNELAEPTEVVAKRLLEAWERHLEDEGLVVLVEPALKEESRKLLEIRRALIDQTRKQRLDWFQILLPCLGSQACGALAAEGDWCHEEVSWWRPEYSREIDKQAGLDRKTLPFSYLVIAKSKRPLAAWLPHLRGDANRRYRLVSPAHREGKRHWDFYLCGQSGKFKSRMEDSRSEIPIGRGSILNDLDAAPGQTLKDALKNYSS
ncbi:MAG: small ribosomal subunit Rsm22 family protein [Bacteriovoracia bacterium]